MPETMSIEYYQEQVKRIGASMRVRAKIGDFVLVDVDGEEVPTDYTESFLEWAVRNIRQRTTALVVATDESSFTIESVTEL